MHSVLQGVCVICCRSVLQEISIMKMRLNRKQVVSPGHIYRYTEEHVQQLSPANLIIYSIAWQSPFSAPATPRES